MRYIPFVRAVFLFIALLRISASVVIGQVMPIQTNVAFTPPYSVHLADYASATSNKMQVQMYLKDETSIPVYVKLRINIELDNNIVITTRKDYIPPKPIQLVGNTPVIINGLDLAPYLDVANLEFPNESFKKEFMRTKKLPEGIYAFSIEVYDYNRNLNLSGKATNKQFVQIFLNEVPVWTMPANNDKLIAQDPQNIFFSWSPRNGASRNGAFTTEYEFSLVELVPEGIDPNVAINAGQPFFTTTTRNTSLVYDISAPPLVPGRKYACRLKAYDLDKLDLFQNGGYSTVLAFTWGDACKPPANILFETATPTSEHITFDRQYNNTSISILYRDISDSTSYSDWYTDILTATELSAGEHIIKFLKPSTKYELQLKATCALVSSDFSTSQTFITSRNVPTDTVNNACGKNINIPVIAESDKTLIKSLAVGDSIMVGGFKAKLTDITNNGDSYAGKCIVNVTTFGIKVNSHFTKIKVNSKKQVYEGEIIADWDPSSLIDINKLASQGLSAIELAKQELEQFKSLVADCKEILIQDPTIIDVISALDTFTNIPPDVTTALKDINDGQKQVDQGKVLISQGRVDEGEALIAQGKGKIDAGKQALLEQAGIQKDKLASELVFFTPASEQVFSFDSLDITKAPLTKYYENYMDINKNRIVFPWKSLPDNGSDKVNFKTSLKSDSVVFKTNTDILLTPVGNQLDVSGGSGNLYIKAFQKIKTSTGKDSLVATGKLNLAKYPLLSPKVYVVPVNGNSTDMSALEGQLNAIYKCANTQWQVDTFSSLDVPELVDTSFQVTGVATLSNYTDDMNTVIDNFKQANEGYDKDAYYLFLISKTNSDRAGFMPLSRKWGFLFTDQAANVPLLNTAAHELGHGAFRLRHTFSDALGDEMITTSTNNLMDYNGGTTLWKNQWDNIHNPAFGLYFFQDEKEGAAATATAVSMTGCMAFLNTKDVIQNNTYKVLPANTTNKLQAYYYTNNKIVKLKIDVKLEILPEGSKTKVNYPADITTWYTIDNNKGYDIPATSLPEGKYTMTFKLNSQTATRIFFIRKYTYNYACSICGRNLELTDIELKKIFPEASILDDANVVKALNDGFKKVGFKTCNHLAHFLAQVKLESVGLTRTSEGYTYFLHRMLEVFNGNVGSKFWYEQNFWDDKKYLKFVGSRVYEKMATATYDYSVDLTDFEIFKHKSTGSLIKVPKDYSAHDAPHNIAYNGYKLKTGNGYYRSISLSDNQRLDNGKRLLNAAYAQKNGNIADTTMAFAEGYNYRGRGLIQVTGKSLYIDADVTLLAKPFELNYDFEHHPERMAEKIAGIWASFAWFYKNIKIPDDLNTENPDLITKKVNSKSEQAAKRKEYYNDIRLNYLQCNKP